jgi:hypothetical protein
MSQLGLQYMHTWKCYKETPCIAILNKQKYLFFSFTKLGNRMTEHILSGGLVPVRRGCRMFNMAQILCTHIRKWKNEPC